LTFRSSDLFRFYSVRNFGFAFLNAVSVYKLLFV